MTWIEIIKIQAAGGRDAMVYEQLSRLMQTTRRRSDCEELNRIDFLRHGSIPGRFALLLEWESASPDVRGSKLALSLLRALNDLGLSSHAVWIETEETYV